MIAAYVDVGADGDVVADADQIGLRAGNIREDPAMLTDLDAFFSQLRDFQLHGVHLLDLDLIEALQSASYLT